MRPLPLYDEALLQRSRRPAGAGELAEPRSRARADNPLCGDEIEVDVRAADGRIDAIAHRARGCALVAASASLLVETTAGATADGAVALGAALRAWLSGGGMLPSELAPLQAVRVFPSRARCVLLPWDAFAQALSAADEIHGAPSETGAR